MISTPLPALDCVVHVPEHVGIVLRSHLEKVTSGHQPFHA